jgi:hypothetical protein
MPAKKETIPPLDRLKKRAIAMVIEKKAYMIFFSMDLDINPTPRDNGMIMPINPAKWFLFTKGPKGEPP